MCFFYFSTSKFMSAGGGVWVEHGGIMGDVLASDF